MHNWQQALGEEKNKAYFTDLMQRIEQARASGKVIYPPKADTFNALKFTPLEDVKVVILGQDPYHGAGQAHGLCFSVLPGVKPPPSLNNIYKELSADIPGFTPPEHGDLSAWAEQGVLLLNTVLTVEEGNAHSHAKWGWETFTDAVIDAVNRHTEHTVFMLWGSHAQKKGRQVSSDRHLVLQSPHPSPLSAHRGFLGCRHFSQANNYLQAHGKRPVAWQN